MEARNIETNGCEDGPTPVAVSNHSDSPQNGKLSERQVIKPATPSALQEGRSTRHSSSSNRLRRHSPGVTLQANKSSPPERRATRQSPPIHTSTNERRLMKNSVSTSHMQIQSNKCASSSHNASQSSQIASSTIPTSTVITITDNSNVKSNKHPSQSPSLNKKRPKRTVTPEPENSTPRASKRIRLQYQPFQSPPPPTIIPPILRHSPKTPDDKIVVFNKGEFLAVRNENGTFFVCRTAQNVYKSSRRFKIQWLNNDDKDIYTPDFYDYTDFECVLTNLRMRRADKNKYHLPSDEWKRTMNILQRALNVENGMDIPDPHQVTMDGVDVSIVGNEEEEALLQQQQHQQQQQTSKAESSSRNNRLRGRGRPKKSGLNIRTNLRSSDAGQKQQKESASKLKLESRELAKVKFREKQSLKQKEPGGRHGILSETV